MHHPFFTLGAYIDDAAKAEDMIAEEIRRYQGHPQKSRAVNDTAVATHNPPII